MKQLMRLKRTMSIMTTALMVMTSVPFYSGTVQAAVVSALPYVDDFEASAWTPGIYLPNLGTYAASGTTTNNVTVNGIKFTDTIDANLVNDTNTAKLNAEVVTSSNGSKALHLYDDIKATSKGNIDAYAAFPAQTLASGAKVNIDYDFMTNTLTGGATGNGGNNGARFRVAGNSDNLKPISIETASGKLQYRNAANALIDFSPALTLTAGSWYHTKLQINLSNSTFDITVTDVNLGVDYKASAVGFITSQTSGLTDIGGLHINTGDGATMELYLDNLQIYNPIAAPTGLAATNGNAQVKLDWSTVTGATYYSVKRSQTAGGPYTQVATNITTALATATYTDTNLTNGTTYYYVVAASNALSASANSSEVSATPIAPSTLAAPTGLAATAGNAKVDLAWNSVANATSYNVKRSTDGSTYATIAPNVLVPSYSDSSVTNGTTYYYVVTAVNASTESVNSNQVSALPAAPAAPVTPANVAAAAGNTQVTLSWGSVSGAASYNVKQSLTPGGPYSTIANVTSGTSYTNTGLTNGTAYYYVVSAVNAFGESPNSGEIFAKPGVFFINDNFENSTLGDTPPGYVSIANAADVKINNVTVINNNNLTNKYYSPSEVAPANNKSAIIPGNSTNVLWVNDNADAGRRGGFTNSFTPVSGKNGLTAELSFMEPKVIGDSYPLELLDSSGKTVLSFSVTNLNALETVNPGGAATWYNLKFVTDTGTNSADVYFNGKYRGNYKFATQDTNIAKIQARTAGSSTGSLYIDNVKVYQQNTVTPQNLTTGGANQTVMLNWNAASGVNSYNVYRSLTAGGPYTRVAANVPSPTYTDTGLVNKTNYYYVVTGVSANGEGDASNEALGYPNNVPAPAIAPEIVQTDIRDSQISLAWNAVSVNDDEGKEVKSSYTLLRSTTENGPFVTIAQKLTDPSYLEKGLTNGTIYYYQVFAENMGGVSPSSKLLKIAPAAPVAASTLLSAAPGNGKVDLNWSSVSQATYYSVKRSELNGGPYTKIKDVAGGTNYTDTDVTNGKTYYYVISASRVIQNNLEQKSAISDLSNHLAQESMISNQLKAIPFAVAAGAPVKPAGFKAIANDGSVKLSWDTVSGATGYNVKRATTSGGPYTTLALTSQTPYVDSNVTNGTTYYYVINAVNASGESPTTDEIVVLPAKVLTVDKNADTSSTEFGKTLFNTIQSAINKIPSTNSERTIVYINPGTYAEKLTVDRPYVSLVGSGMDVTTIVYGDYAGTSATTGKPGHTGNTFLSQTVKVTGDNFTSANLTIENSAAPRSAVAQAVALSLYSDKASFESVKLKGYQDTLYDGLNASNKGRHYFHNSIIQGDVDFIFGEGPAVVMDNVKMVLVSNSGGGGHITAGAQKNITDKGYVFFNSQIVDDASAQGVYDLGRGWKDYARVSFINTLIDSKKFLNEGWAASCAGSCITNYFSEYNSYGTGANPSARQLGTQLTGPEASLTIPQIFADWDPSISVMMPKVQYLPSVSVISSNFDKSAAKQADIQVALQNNGAVFKSITNGTTALGASDYTLTGNFVTLNKTYLATLQEGTTALNFNFDTISVPLTINVINSDASDIGKQVLAVNDGWGSFTTGTTGGSKAAPANIYTVSSRSELIQALGGDNSKNATNATPKIIYVKGTIDMNVDENNNPVGFDYYKDPAYDFQAYLAAYDPAVWGKSSVPSGALETARAASEANQGAKIKINVGSNTTIVGLSGSNAKIIGGNLMIQNVDNVIIRNIDFQNAFDYFPQWDPTDGDSGNWNSAFDNITVKGATHIWIDHNTFSDGKNRDDYNVKYFGRQYQQHDGAVDITNASDLITVSYNYFHDHDKTTLVGGSDSYTADRGKERITFHHNYYQNVTQRVPRVRFGQVHVYNNYYEGTMNNENYPFLYTMGVGFESQIYAENNYFVQDAGTPASALIQVSPGGTVFTDKGSVLNGAAVNIAQSKGGLSPVGWTPTLYTSMDATAAVPGIVKSSAGAENTLPSQPTPAAPAAPGGLTATAGNAQVALQWSSVTGATYYNVKRSTTKGGAYTNVATNVSTASYTDKAVVNGTTYYYVVTAANTAGESVNSVEASATPTAPVTPVQPPAAPGGLTATAGNAQVVLQWSSVTGATYYNVKRSTTKGGAYTTIAANVTSTTYTNIGLVNGTTYYYVVTAANTAGESINSAEVSAMPYISMGSHHSSGGSTGGGGPTTATPAITVQPVKDGVQILNLSPVTEKTADGKSAVKVTLDGTALTQVLNVLKASNGPSEQRVYVEVKGNNEQVGKLEIPAPSVTDLMAQTPKAVISLKYGGATYDLPLKAIDIASVAGKLGAASKDVSIIIAIEKVNGTTASSIEAKAKQAGLNPLVPAIDFTVTAADSSGNQVAVNDFGIFYVSRTMELTKEVDPKKTTVVLYNPATGTFSFVPAVFTATGGVSKATVKRPGNSIYTVVEYSKSFDDLKGHWAQADVELLASKLVVNGTTDGSFAPQHEITRSEFAALLVRALGLTETTPAKFSDVSATDWFAGAIGAASQAGLIDGFEDGSFKPAANITREQMAAMLTRAMSVAGKKADGGLAGLSKFSDAASISGWAKDAVAQAVNAGIINGVTGDTFVPNAKASRAEAAVMLKRLLQYEQLMN